MLLSLKRSRRLLAILPVRHLPHGQRIFATGLIRRFKERAVVDCLDLEIQGVEAFGRPCRQESCKRSEDYI